MIIFGTRAYLQAIAMVNFICTNCHNPAAQRVLRRVVRFTLFFIPLFPVSTSYSTTCTFCGLTSKINKEQAESYAAHGQPQGAYGQRPQAAYGQRPQAAYGQQPQGAYGQQPQGAYGQQPQPQSPQPQSPQLPAPELPAPGQYPPPAAPPFPRQYPPQS